MRPKFNFNLTIMLVDPDFVYIIYITHGHIIYAIYILILKSLYTNYLIYDIYKTQTDETFIIYSIHRIYIIFMMIKLSFILIFYYILLSTIYNETQTTHTFDNFLICVKLLFF